MTRGLPVALLALFAAAAAAQSAQSADEHEYRAVAGDTLIGIGRALLIEPRRWRDVARLNRLPDPDRIAIGQPLRIPLAWLRTEPVAAVLVGSSGALHAPAVLAEGSELRTGADGHAVVRLVDGSLLRLRPASRLQISESRRVPGTDIRRARARLPDGRVEIEAPRPRGGTPGFRIETPQGVLGVRGTRFRVAAVAGLTRGEVLEGLVAFAGSAAPQAVAAGQGSLIDADGRVAPPLALLAAPALPAAVPLQERIMLRLPLPAVAGAVAYRAQIVPAGAAGFDLPLAEVLASGTELRLADLPDGDYRLRLRAIDARGLEGRDAEASLRIKARPEPPLPSRPAAGERVIGSRVEFRWATQPQAASYRLQVAAQADRDFGAPLRELRDLDMPTAAVDGLDRGSYRWRMRSVRHDGDLGPWGDAQSFDLRSVPPGSLSVSADDHRLTLAWQGLPGQQFDLQLARSPDFEPLLGEQRLRSTQVELPRPGSGRVWIRLRAVDPDGWVGPFGQPQFVDILHCLRDASAACVRQFGQPVLTTP